jgi:hypothetical protein
VDDRGWPRSPHAPPEYPADAWLTAGHGETSAAGVAESANPTGWAWRTSQPAEPASYEPASYAEAAYDPPTGYDQAAYNPPTGYDPTASGTAAPGYRDYGGYEGYRGYEDGYPRSNPPDYQRYAPPPEYPEYRGEHGYADRAGERPGRARPERAAAGRMVPTEAVPAPEVDPEQSRPSLAATLLWTLGAFLLPIAVYLGWATTLGTEARPGCVDATGAPCAGPRTQAVENLFSVLPALVVALGAALLIAIGIRRIATTWRGYKVAFAASVIGAGLTTLVVSALG